MNEEDREQRVKKIEAFRALFAEVGLAILHWDDDQLLNFVDKIIHKDNVT